MLYIQLERASRPIEYHIGDGDVNINLRTCANLIKWIQADGDELVFIKRIFTQIINGEEQVTIPFPRLRVVTWYGDFAKIICGNWKE